MVNKMLTSSCSPDYSFHFFEQFAARSKSGSRTAGTTHRAITSGFPLHAGERAVQAFLVFPEVENKAKAVIVIHENRGLTDWGVQRCRSTGGKDISQ